MIALNILAQTDAPSLSAPESPQEFFQYVVDVWIAGGWVMAPLALLTIYIFFEATALILNLGQARIKKVPVSVWGQWINEPENGKGYIGDVIRYITAGGFNSLDIMARIEATRQSMIPAINQKILLIGVLVTIAPLMGLLGTVIGMLTTFRGLASSTGQAVDMVASGIRVALITTQTGLMIAIPGYILIAEVVKRRNQFNAFFAQLENLTIQECARRGTLKD